MTDNYKTLEWTDYADKLVTMVECPCCGDKYHLHVPYAKVGCGKCGAVFNTDFKQSIYTKNARAILGVLAWENGVIIKSSESFQRDILHAKDDFERMRSFDVSEVTRIIEEHVRCDKCGVCKNCFECKDCHEHFTRNENRRKLACPKCHSDKFIKTYFKEVLMRDDNKHIKLCPYCKTDKIYMTRSRTKKKCHLCGSTKVSEPKSETMFLLTIERKGAYRK